MTSIIPVNQNGGHREFFSISAKITKKVKERHWKNLWLKITERFYLEIISEPPSFKFMNYFGDNLKFPEKITIHDFTRDLEELNIEDILDFKIGYADANQQYWNGVNAFVLFYLNNRKEIELVS